jgi:hypothetical protein
MRQNDVEQTGPTSAAANGMVLVVVVVEVLVVVESVGRGESGLPNAGLQPTTANAVATNAPIALARPFMSINYRHTPNLTESVREKRVIWRSLGVLAGAVAVILLAVVGLAQITVPDVPTFEDGLEAGEEFIPTAVGARLEIAGAREGTVDLEFDGIALEDSKTKLFFSADPLAVDQLYYDGLTFFPEPDECEFTTGHHNEELGLVAVEMSCPELVDIRDNGSVSVEGRVALPAEWVVELGIPDTGGTITVGNEEWTIIPEVGLTTGDEVIFEPDGHPGMDMYSSDPEKWINLAYDVGSGALFPGTLHYQDDVVDLGSAGCTLQSQVVLALGPQSRYHELTIDCEAVPLPGAGTVPLNGTVTYQEFEFVAEP